MTPSWRLKASPAPSISKLNVHYFLLPDSLTHFHALTHSCTPFHHCYTCRGSVLPLEHSVSALSTPGGQAFIRCPILVRLTIYYYNKIRAQTPGSYLLKLKSTGKKLNIESSHYHRGLIQNLYSLNALRCSFSNNLSPCCFLCTAGERRDTPCFGWRDLGPQTCCITFTFHSQPANVSQLTGTHSSTIVDRISQTLITSATFI